MTDSHQLLDEILSLTRQLHQHASQAQWDHLSPLEQARTGLIERCFPLDGSITDPAQAATTISEIISLDRQVMDRVRDAQQEIGQQLGKFRQGREATHAYQAIEY